MFMKLSCWDNNHDGTQTRGRSTSIYEPVPNSIRTLEVAFIKGFH